MKISVVNYATDTFFSNYAGDSASFEVLLNYAGDWFCCNYAVKSFCSAYAGNRFCSKYVGDNVSVAIMLVVFSAVHYAHDYFYLNIQVTVCVIAM